MADGSLLVGSWLNSCLFTTQVIAGTYFLKRCSPSALHRNIVVSALCVDAASTVVGYANTFLLLWTLRDKVLTANLWTLPVQIILTYLSAVAEQLLFVHRFYSLSRSLLVTGILTFFIFLHWFFGIFTGIYVAVHPQFAVNFGLTATILAATTCAFTDVLIAVTLVVKLYKMPVSYISTASLIRRVSIQALTCGVLTAVMTSLMLILLFTNLSGFQLVFTCLGRIYSLTLLANLLLLRPSNTSHEASRDLAGGVALDTIVFRRPEAASSNSPTRKVSLILDDNDVETRSPTKGSYP